MIVDGTRYESEDPDVYSNGSVYTNGGLCGPGNWQSEIMHCNGWLQYPIDQPTAPGTPGSTALEVDYIGIDGNTYPASDTAVTKLGVSSEGCEVEVNTTDDTLDCQPGWFDYQGVTDLYDPGAPPTGHVTVTYTRDPGTGRPTNINYPGGGERAFTYDDAGRITGDTLTDDTSTVTASIGYGWDCENNLTSKTVDHRARRPRPAARRGPGRRRREPAPPASRPAAAGRGPRHCPPRRDCPPGPPRLA